MTEDWWLCPCGFNAKEFEPRPEKQVGAARWHKAVCDDTE